MLPEGDTTSLQVSVESYQEAYTLVGEDDLPLKNEVGLIAGVTFDDAQHPDVTAGKSYKGGRYA